MKYIKHDRISTSHYLHLTISKRSNINMKSFDISLICMCLFFLPYVDTCMQEYYEKLGDEQDIPSGKGPCILIIRSQKDRWLRLWLYSTIISPEIPVSVTLKGSSGKVIKKWTLKSSIQNRVRNFDSLEKGNWFEINHTTSISFKFKSYSAC